MNAIVRWFKHSLILPFLGTRMRIGHFQSCGPCWVFQICWHTECKTLMESSFRNLNSSSGISLDPLALLTAMLLKAHWLHTAECLGLWVINHTIIVIQFIISFLYSSSMYFFHLFLIHLSFTRSLPFVSFTVPIWVECSLEVSNYSWRVNCT